MEEKLEIEHTKLGVPLRETRKGKNDIFFRPVLERNKSAAKLVEIVRHFIHCWKATGSAGKGPSAPLLSSSLRFALLHKMLNSQRSLSELPKMTAASQVERAVLVSTVLAKQSQSSRLAG